MSIAEKKAANKNITIKALQEQLQLAIDEKRFDDVSSINTAIKELQTRKNEKARENAEKKQARELKKVEYSNTHLFFEIEKNKYAVMKGYIFENAIAITNYTLDGYIVICADKLNRPFVTTWNKSKEGKKSNTAMYTAKRELLNATYDTIKRNILAALKTSDFNACLEKCKNCSGFKPSSEVKNKRLPYVVERTIQIASKYDK